MPSIPHAKIQHHHLERLSNLSDDEPLYDAVASDDDYAALSPVKQTPPIDSIHSQQQVKKSLPFKINSIGWLATSHINLLIISEIKIEIEIEHITHIAEWTKLLSYWKSNNPTFASHISLINKTNNNIKLMLKYILGGINQGLSSSILHTFYDKIYLSI